MSVERRINNEDLNTEYTSEMILVGKGVMYWWSKSLLWRYLFIDHFKFSKFIFCILNYVIIDNKPLWLLPLNSWCSNAHSFNSAMCLSVAAWGMSSAIHRGSDVSVGGSVRHSQVTFAVAAMCLSVAAWGILKCHSPWH